MYRQRKFLWMFERFHRRTTLCQVRRIMGAFCPCYCLYWGRGRDDGLEIWSWSWDRSKPLFEVLVLTCLVSVAKMVLWSRGGAHLTKPGWSKPHTHSNPTNLALFRPKITLYSFNRGTHTIAGGSNGSRGGWAPPPRAPPSHFNHCLVLVSVLVSKDGLEQEQQ